MKKGTIKRIIYGIIGIVALMSTIWALMDIKTFFTTMGLWGSIGYWLLVIGGLNWGLVAIFKKDLFEMLGM
jgi:uncharacterized membrane protein YuzA (DUF378 family)